MKKLIPYILSLILGTFFGYLIFEEPDFKIDNVFASTLTVKAFQIGVFNNKAGALELKKKYNTGIIMEDDDVYRVYYSMLTNDKVIKKMESYLTKENINYTLKIITLNDENLIKAINEYEEAMNSGSDTLLVSLNNLIMSSFEGEI